MALWILQLTLFSGPYGNAKNLSFIDADAQKMRDLNLILIIHRFKDTILPPIMDRGPIGAK